MTRRATDTQIETMQRALAEFGYGSLAVEDVRTEADALLAGDKPDNIIGMFLRGWLRDAGLLEA